MALENPSEPKRDYAAEAEQIMRSAKSDTQRVFRPLGAICTAIIQASTNCRDLAKTLITGEDATERQEKEIYAFFEFIYFFMHMTLRKVHGRIPPSKLRLLQDFLLAIVPGTAIDSYFAHWPKHLKNDLVDEFVERLDASEMEYGTCTADGDKSRILLVLCNHLIEIFDSGATSVQTIRPALDAVVRELEGLRLEEHIREFMNNGMNELDDKRMGESLDQFRSSGR